MREVVAFLGFEGTGKTYRASKLVKERNFLKLSFADVLREIAFGTLGMNFDEGMNKYNELKRTEIYNGQNFRNILENLGSCVRKYSKDFWANAVLEKIKNSTENICIDDMRYPNEYVLIKNYCVKNNIDFKAIYCNYRSENYKDDNPHESAVLARRLYDLGYKDGQYVNGDDIAIQLSEDRVKELSGNLNKVMSNFRRRMA